MAKQDIYNFFSKIYRDNVDRVSGRRDIWKDMKQYVLNESLLPKEQQLIEQYYSEEHPVIFIVGVPRSGTTLLAQLLVKYFGMGYINNQVAKYWMAPLSALTKQDSDQGEVQLSSFLGNTEGAGAPHEFGYFWQYWLDHDEHDELSDAEMNQVDWEGLRKELYSMAGYFQRPFLMKSLNYINFKISRMARECPNSRFLYIRREPMYCIQSILESRVKRYGSQQKWWSIRPANYEKWMNLPPLEQIAHQYFYTDQEISRQLKSLPSGRYEQIDYEQLINATDKEMQRLSAFLNMAMLEKVDQREIENGNEWRLQEYDPSEVERTIDNIKMQYK